MRRTFLLAAFAVLLMATILITLVKANLVEEITEEEFASRVQTGQLDALLLQLSGETVVLVGDPLDTNEMWWATMLIKQVTDPEGNEVQGATVAITNLDSGWLLYMKLAVPAGGEWQTDPVTSTTDEYGYCYFYFMWIGGGLSQSRQIDVEITKDGFLPSSEVEVIFGEVFNMFPDDLRTPYYGYNLLENSLERLPTQVIPEVPLGTVVASAAMITALISYVAIPKWRRKQQYINL